MQISYRKYTIPKRKLYIIDFAIVVLNTPFPYIRNEF